MDLHVICGFTDLTFFFQEQEINDELEFLIIASDGLWDVVPNEVNLLSTSVTYFRADPSVYHSSWAFV
jgi:serine/threonine protein phosphatase PrpC